MKRIGILAAAGAAILLGGHAASAGNVANAFAIEPGTYTVGARLLFDYQPDCKSAWFRDIDVVNVWEMVVSEKPNGSSQVDFQPLSTPTIMMDGPFAGYGIALDFSLHQLSNGLFKGAQGNLSFYTPTGELWDPDGNARNGVSEKINTRWNGQFGADGVYAIGQTRSSNFFRWKAHDIVTFVDPGNYSLETGLFWNEYAAMPYDGNQANNINFTLTDASAVPEPASLLLIGASLAGLVGLRRKK